MRSTRILLTTGALSLLAMSGIAGADSNHQILDKSAVLVRGKKVGFRGSALLDPQNLTKAHPTLPGDTRMGIGGMKFTNLNSSNSNQHRDAAAGVQPGYLLHQLVMREITGPNPADRGPAVVNMNTGGQQKEVEFEVLYKDNPLLIPGSKVDLVAGFWKGSYWHIWGAAQGPMHSSQDFVVELPGKANTRSYQRALKFLKSEETRLTSLVADAAPKIAAAEQVLRDAQAARSRSWNTQTSEAVTKAELELNTLKAPAGELQMTKQRITEYTAAMDAFVAAKAAATQAPPTTQQAQ